MDSDPDPGEEKCTSSRCLGNIEKNVLLCSKCNRNVHFQCSFLPAYQVQFYIMNRKRNMKHYICISCVDVPKDVVDICKAGNHTQAYIDRIKFLEKDLEACKNIIKNQQEKETIQVQQIETLKSKVVKLKEKTHTIEHLKKEVKEQISEMGSMIKVSICSQVNKTFEAISNTTSGRSYAMATGGSQINELKTIIKEARHAELTEERDHKSRANNIIVHGVAEFEDEIEGDKTYTDNLIEDIKVPVKITKISRIGIKSNVKKRPIKISFSNQQDKLNILKNLSALKNNDKYKGMSITEDLTLTERAILREWLEKAKEKNEKLPPESKSIWRVRGDSKNGYRLKEFAKSC